MPAARHGASDAIARSRQREEAFRLSSAVRPVCGSRASPRASTASTGFIAKKASRCASDGLGGAPWGRGRRTWSKSKPNARWSVDFVHDQLACGRRLRILNIVDDVTRECLAAIPDTSISGRRVARELTALIKRRGKPGMIVSDNGPSLPRTPCSPGRRTTASSGISLRQESRCRMASARVSTGACATSFSGLRQQAHQFVT